MFHPNLDSRWVPGVDLTCDFYHPLPVPDKSFDGVWAKFVLEHISWRKMRQFIAEMHRILAPGGVAVVVTANLLEQCKRLVEAPEWDNDLICMLFGDQDYPENTHHCGLSPAYAVKLFKEAGFYEVRVLPWPAAATDMVVEAWKSRALVEVRS